MQYAFTDTARKLLAVLALSAFTLSTVSSFFFAVPQARAETQTCSTITLVSDASSMTAGYTEMNPVTSAVALMPASYSGGSYSAASLTQTVIPPWVDPAVDPTFMGSGAMWISSHTTWPGGAGNTEGSATSSQWRLLEDSFVLPVGATVTDATVYFTADNAVGVYLNGNPAAIASTNGMVNEDVYGPTPVGGPSNYAQVFTSAFTPVVGNNTLDFVVRNWSTEDSATNPTGLLYKAVVNYCVTDVEPEEETVTVTIDKFIDGSMAMASTTGGASFPMSATWNAENIGSGTGTYSLAAENTPAYEAETAEMTSGADYSTYEMTDGAVVGASCTTEKPFALVGYTYGNTFAQAAAGTPTTTAPNFMNLQSDKYVIVWNHACDDSSGEIGGDVTGGVSSNGTLAVTSISPVDTTATADNTYENGWSYTFNITVPTNEQYLKMKFADWFNAAASSTLAAGGNMRISSAQADNGGATVPIVAANVYSTPALHMTADLNPSMPGLQVQVVVQVKIPASTVNGAYTTTYGVQSLP